MKRTFTHSKSLKEYIEKRIAVLPSGCHHWQGPVDIHGDPTYTFSYGDVREWGGVLNYLSEQSNSPLRNKKIVMSCGNPRCVNVEHAQLKNIEEAIRDDVLVDSKGCWVWKKGVTRPCNRKITINGETVSPRVYLYNNHYNTNAWSVVSLCDNPACINPEHHASHTHPVGRKKIFASKVKVDEKTGCHCWLGGRNNIGYGMVVKVDNSGMQTAHRAAYETFVGKIPAGAQVLHTCDNPLCVNPQHLFLGDVKSNMHDKLKKGRMPSTRRRITMQTAEKIRQLHIDGYSYTSIAKMIGIHMSNVGRIVLGKSHNGLARGPRPKYPRDVYEKIEAMYKEGIKVAAIAKRLGIKYQTAYQYLHRLNKRNK